MIGKLLFFSGHALRRMFERNISKKEVKKIIKSGIVIAEYADDKPFPSHLLLGFIAGRPIHVVVANELGNDTYFVITAYDPDPALWDDEFKNKRRR